MFPCTMKQNKVQFHFDSYVTYTVFVEMKNVIISSPVLGRE